MAYAFSRVNQALGGTPDQENQDIFGGNQPQNQVQGQEPVAGVTPQGVTKTSTANIIGAANPTSEIRTPQETAASGGGAASKILATNQSTVPNQVSQLGGKLASASAGLQTEADQYVKNAANTNYGASNSDIGDLVGGSGSAGSLRAANLLSGTQAPRAESFAPKTQTNFQEVGELGSEAGIQNMLRRQAGARATSGELGIESALLRRDPRFQQTRSQLVGQGAALAAQRAAQLGAGGAQERAQAAQDLNYKTAQTDVRKKLGDQQAAIEADAVEKARIENAARKAAQGQGFSADQSFSDAFTKADQNSGYLIDPANYAKWAGDVSTADMYDQGGAERFSRISDLLGTPGARRVAGKGAGSRVNFDTNAYSKALEAAKAMPPIMPDYSKAAAIPGDGIDMSKMPQADSIFPGPENTLPARSAPEPERNPTLADQFINENKTATQAGVDILFNDPNNLIAENLGRYIPNRFKNVRF